MSEKFLNEERTAELWGAMKSYVGGSGDGSGTTIDSSKEVYSTEERVVGIWIDGKPIYRISIPYTVTNTGATVIHTFSSISTITSMQVVHTITDGSRLSVPYLILDQTSSSGIVFYIMKNGKAEIRVNTATFCGSGVATIEYTKTEDKVLSGVIDEVYSTEETRIGTWFGKPLYRRGVDVVLPDAASLINSAGILDLEETCIIQNYRVTFSRSNGIRFINQSCLPGASYCGGAQISENLHSLWAMFGSDIAWHIAGTTALIIVDYTKTTD